MNLRPLFQRAGERRDRRQVRDGIRDPRNQRDPDDQGIRRVIHKRQAGKNPCVRPAGQPLVFVADPSPSGRTGQGRCAAGPSSRRTPGHPRMSPDTCGSLRPYRARTGRQRSQRTTGARPPRQSLPLPTNGRTACPGPPPRTLPRGSSRPRKLAERPQGTPPRTCCSGYTSPGRSACAPEQESERPTSQTSRQRPHRVHRVSLCADLGKGGLRLGVRAPLTTEGASFEEHGCSHPRAVLHGETLDVEHRGHARGPSRVIPPHVLAACCLS